MTKSITKPHKLLAMVMALCMALSVFAFISVDADAATLSASLTVSVTAGSNKVYLMPQTAETGHTYYYQVFTDAQATDPDEKAYEGDTTGWTAYSAACALTGTGIENGTQIYVMVIKVEDTSEKIVAWGEAAVTPSDLVGGTSTGLTGVTSTTIYNLKAVVNTAPSVGEEFVIQKRSASIYNGTDPVDEPLTTGYKQQSSDLVTIKLGKTTDASLTTYLTGKTGDVFYTIGGGSQNPDGTTIFQQSTAFIALFDSCGGTFAFNTNADIGHRYGCMRSGVQNAVVSIYTYDAFELNGISVELDSDNKLAAGQSASKDNIAKVVGTYVNINNPSEKVSSELDVTQMVTDVKFLDASGGTVTNYDSSTVVKLRVTVTDKNISTIKFTADVAIIYSAPEQNPVSPPAKDNTDITPPTGDPDTTEGTDPTPGEIVIDGTENVYEDVISDETSGTTTAIVDSASLKEQIDAATPGTGVTLVVPTTETTTGVTAQLTMDVVDSMHDKNMELTIQTGDIRYSLPTDAVDTSAILDSLGAPDTSDVVFNVIINNTVSAETEALTTAAVEFIGGEIVLPAMEFTIEATYNGQTVSINAFSSYVSRTIELTEEEAKRITTALIIEPDGASRHVPTYVYQEGGKWYVTINSMTNSTYVLIYNYKTFDDVQDKWYSSSVTELASRKIISGATENTFEGDRSITRAEFTAIVIRALGLPESGNASQFKDVASDAWYAGVVGTAYGYGLVKGRTDTTFEPNANITRQEAMLIVQRMAAVTGLEGSAEGYSGYADADDVSGWASDAVAFNVGSGLITGYEDNTLKPLGDITRAETATVILRLLRNSTVVDDRTGQY